MVSRADLSSAHIRAVAAWGGSGIPRRLWGYALAAHIQTYPETEQLGAWVTGFTERHALDDTGYARDRAGYGQGLFLYGPPGRGKTTAACATLTSFHKLYSRSVYFIRWDNFLRARQALIGGASHIDSNVDYEAAIHAVERSDLVALDDVGHEYSASAFGPAQLDQLIRSRFDRGAPTIITTNLSETAWTEKYDGTLTSFIKRACMPIAFSDAG